MELLWWNSLRFQFLTKRGSQMKKWIVLLALCLSISVNAQKENKSFSVVSDSKENNSVAKLSGVLSIDSRIAFDQTKELNQFLSTQESPDKKSSLLAAGMSLLLPGAGEFYAERYFKSGIFVAVEAASIIIGLAYNKKGDDQTNFFQGFADQHWSAVRYAKWTIKNVAKINSSIVVSNYKVFDNNQNVNWSELNRLEGDIGGYYSHRLPGYGEQQYFELIGKYPQFNVGWDDFGDENTPFEYDPTRSNLTSRFVYYSVERGKANDYYNIASKAVVVIVVNHIISALDAAWSAHNYNKSLEVHASLEKFQDGLTLYYYPQLNLQYRF
jgi:hypothetical protein